MAGEELLFYISKEAMELVYKGVAKISSGGVRMIESGQLVELAKPLYRKEDGSLEMINAIAGNVNNVGLRLNDAVSQVNLLTTSVEKFSELALSLEWANCALGIVNCGISIAGFAVMNHKLNKVSEQLTAIAEKIDYNMYAEHIEKFNKFLSFLEADWMDLEKGDYVSVKSKDHFEEIYAFLLRIAEDFSNRKVAREIAVTILYSLGNAFAETYKKYVEVYFDDLHELPANYDRFMNVLVKINSDSVKRELKHYLLYEVGMDVSIEDKYRAYNASVYSISHSIGLLEFEKKRCLSLEANGFENNWDNIVQMIKKREFQEEGDFVLIPAV